MWNDVELRIALIRDGVLLAEQSHPARDLRQIVSEEGDRHGDAGFFLRDGHGLSQGWVELVAFTSQESHELDEEGVRLLIEPLGEIRRQYAVLLPHFERLHHVYESLLHHLGLARYFPSDQALKTAYGLYVDIGHHVASL